MKGIEADWSPGAPRASRDKRDTPLRSLNLGVCDVLKSVATGHPELMVSAFQPQSRLCSVTFQLGSSTVSLFTDQL